MSGGETVKIAASGGGSPVLHKQRAEGWGDRWQAPKAHAKGLVLTEDGGADPNQKRRSSARLGWHQITRKGWKPDGRDYRLGSRQPGHKVVHRKMCE
ncbi:hypothetical protein BAR1_09115 [Profundibacter amoris]|uniref:Uncharacterized protein n=1 Tax=Profundibacter amoris TaxID=2171755 RepID=A0A347UGV0_9RHOB|nr:hypothetical protein BAR1_09115 [Profundibacter amoris]